MKFFLANNSPSGLDYRWPILICAVQLWHNSFYNPQCTGEKMFSTPVLQSLNSPCFTSTLMQQWKCSDVKNPIFISPFVMCVLRLDTIQSTLFTTSPSLDPSLPVHQAPAQISAWVAMSVLLVAGRIRWTLDQEDALSMVRPEVHKYKLNFSSFIPDKHLIIWEVGSTTKRSF